MTRRLVVVVVLVAICSAAHAQPDPDATGSAAAESPKAAAQDHFAAGQKQFDAGEYLPAANEFEAAFALDPDPVFLYNAAQAYRLGSACARAADYYRRFLAAVPNPPNLEKVQHYLHELDACVKAEAAETPTQPTESTPAQPIAAPPMSVTTSTQPPQLDGRRPMAVPIAVASGGIAALALAGVLTHDVQTLEGYSQALCSPGVICQWDTSKQSRADDLQSRGRRDSAIAIAAYSLGGAALVASALLYVLLPREPVAITPFPNGGAISTIIEF